MKRLLFYILTSFLLFIAAPTYAVDLVAVCDSLDLFLSQRHDSFERQIFKIKEEEAKLLLTNDKREQFEICYKIFNLTRSYKYDLAYNYAKKCEALANDISDKNLLTLAKANIISTLTSGGLFTQASKVVSSIDVTNVDVEPRRILYYNITRYYSDHLDYATSSGKDYTEYLSKNIIQYCDSIIDLSLQRDFYWVYATAYKAFNENRINDAAEELQKFYDSGKCSPHHNSIVTFLLSDSYFKLNKDELGVKYLVKSVRYDTQAAARENRSIKTMAQYLFNNGEHKISYKLINAAFEDAKFYNARHRNLEINTLLPIVNKQKIESVSQERNMGYFFSAIITILTLISLRLMFKSRKNAKLVAFSAKIIEKQLEELKTTNSLLHEANNIKEYYIAEALYKKNEQMEHFQQILHKIEVKVKNKMYDDLRFVFKEFNIKRERERFLYDFDVAFLKLFPNFLGVYPKPNKKNQKIDFRLIYRVDFLIFLLFSVVYMFSFE